MDRFKTLLVIALGVHTGIFAQNYTSDAIRFSQQPNTAGTARMRALGGNHSAIGADASNITGNPAGLAMFSRSEISIGVQADNLNTNSNYLSTNNSAINSNNNLNNFSMVFGGSKGVKRNGWQPSTYAIGYNRNNSLFNNFSFRGTNNRSSIIDSFVETLNSWDGNTSDFLDSDQSFDAANRIAYSPEAMYYQLYMVNTLPGKNFPYEAIDASNPATSISQRGAFESTGKTSQWTFATSTSYNDKLYLGATIGIARLGYEFGYNYNEVLNGGQFINSLNVDQFLSVTGRGINVSTGVIYRPNNLIRLGATINTPTWYTISESFDQTGTVNVNPNNQNDIPTNLRPVSVATNDFDYELRTPWRASGGAAVFIGKKGFITADAEYVGYTGMRLTANTLSAADNNDFTNINKANINSDFKNVVNLRLGAEGRITNNISLRGGVALLADPYKIKYDNIDRNRTIVSAGAGYRNKKMFLDITGAYQPFTTAFTPYTLSNENDFGSAKIENKLSSVNVSFGVFFR